MLERVILSAVLLFPAAAQEHAGQYAQSDIDRGFRLYAANCTLCHGDNGNSVPNVDLRSGRFRNASTDEELGRIILAGIPGRAMPPHKFDPGELRGVVAYVRSMRGTLAAPVAAGDPARGRTIFAGKGACLTCHRVAGEGSRFAPDLSDIGVIRHPDTLRQSLLDPNAVMLPVNRPIRAVTAKGEVIVGRRLNEDMFSVQIIATDDRLLSLIKADLREYTVSRVSTMPSYREKLSPQELADVVAYLRTLKGIQ
jgi:putative heme-binding domain-containing protein